MNAFNELKWLPDRVILKNLVFLLEYYKSDDWELGANCFTLYKIKEIVDEYEAYFKRNREFKATNVFELGVFRGGSMPFWNELLPPEKHIGIDTKEIKESPYLGNYLEDKKRGNKLIQLFGGVNQADKEKLLALYKQAFNSPLDIVLDDASHFYYESKMSFEALFPLLRPGGLYIIEDWAWGHDEAYFAGNHPWAGITAPTKLIHELTELAGSDKTIIDCMSIYKGFSVVERGSKIIGDGFTIDKFIKRRAPVIKKISIYNPLKVQMKKMLGR